MYSFHFVRFRLYISVISDFVLSIIRAKIRVSNAIYKSPVHGAITHLFFLGAIRDFDFSGAISEVN